MILTSIIQTEDTGSVSVKDSHLVFSQSGWRLTLKTQTLLCFNTVDISGGNLTPWYMLDQVCWHARIPSACLILILQMSMSLSFLSHHQARNKKESMVASSSLPARVLRSHRQCIWRIKPFPSGSRRIESRLRRTKNRNQVSGTSVQRDWCSVRSHNTSLVVALATRWLAR